jgi:DNA polymerase-3 subunit alpha
MASKMEFVNLHHHSTFSYGDGFGTPKAHAERMAQLGYTAGALTEHGNVSSHFQFEKAAHKAGIRPIFGVEAYCGPTRLEEGWGGTEDNPVYLAARSQWKHHLTILAATLEGYRNLNKIVTQSYVDFHYHPTVGGQSLADHADGLVVLSGCSGSQLACALLGGKGTPEHLDEPDLEAAEQLIYRFADLFQGRYFLEVQPFYELPRTNAMNASYEKLSGITGVPIIVTHDVHYPKFEDHEMQAVLHAVHRGKASVDDAMREWNYLVPLTLPASDVELRTRLVKSGLTKRAATAAIEVSAFAASLCDVTLPKADRLQYRMTEQDLKPWV